MWSELVGEGFCEPVDDLGPDRQATAPEAFDFLSAWFAESGYDVKRLMTVIMGTEAYQRESRSRRAPDGTPFAANRLQRLRGDQLRRCTLNLSCCARCCLLNPCSCSDNGDLTRALRVVFRRCRKARCCRN